MRGRAWVGVGGGVGVLMSEVYPFACYTGTISLLGQCPGLSLSAHWVDDSHCLELPVLPKFTPTQHSCHVYLFTSVNLGIKFLGFNTLPSILRV